MKIIPNPLPFSRQKYMQTLREITVHDKWGVLSYADYNLPGCKYV